MASCQCGLETASAKVLGSTGQLILAMKVKCDESGGWGLVVQKERKVVMELVWQWCGREKWGSGVERSREIGWGRRRWRTR
ncbi:unnamed protein product [Prunus brigantina]